MLNYKSAQTMVDDVYNDNSADHQKKLLEECIDESIDKLDFNDAALHLRQYKRVTPELEHASEAYRKSANLLLKKGLTLLAYKAAGLAGVDLAKSNEKEWNLRIKELNEDPHTLEQELVSLHKRIHEDNDFELNNVVQMIMSSVAPVVDKFYNIKGPYAQNYPFMVVYDGRISGSIFCPPKEKGKPAVIKIGRKRIFNLGAYAEEYAHMKRWQFEPNSKEDVQEFIEGLAKLHLGGTLISSSDLDTVNTVLEADLMCNDMNKQWAEIDYALNGKEIKDSEKPHIIRENKIVKEQKSIGNHAIGYGLAKKVRDSGNMDMLVGPMVVLNSLLMLPDSTIRRLAEQYSRKGSIFA